MIEFASVRCLELTDGSNRLAPPAASPSPLAPSRQSFPPPPRSRQVVDEPEALACELREVLAVAALGGRAEPIERVLDDLDEVLGERSGIHRSLDIGVQPEIDAERAVRQLAEAVDLAAQFFRREPQTRENAETAGARDFRRQFRSRYAAHARLKDRHVYAEEIGQRSSEFHG